MPHSHKRRPGPGSEMILTDPAALDGYRQIRGLTKTALAEAITRRGKPVSQQLISLYCLGRRTGATRALATAIEQALEVPPGTLFFAAPSHDERDPVS